jgi:hypothetical protein
MVPARGGGRAVDVIGRALRSLKPGEYVVISKRVLPRLSPSYEETALGTPPGVAHEGAIRQFRGPYRRHVYETPSSWVAHRDYADPRTDPMGHILLDTPELAGAALIGGVAGLVASSHTRRKRIEAGASEADANRDAALNGILAGLLAAGAAYVVISLVKRASRRSR